MILRQQCSVQAVKIAEGKLVYNFIPLLTRMSWIFHELLLTGMIQCQYEHMNMDLAIICLRDFIMMFIGYFIWNKRCTSPINIWSWSECVMFVQWIHLEIFGNRTRILPGHKLSHTGQVGWTDSLLILGCIQCLTLLGHDNSHHLMQGTAQDC